jgi:hypothetical protein
VGGEPEEAGLVQMGVDEIFQGKKQKFITVASNLDTGERLWFGRERKKESPGRVLPDGTEPGAADADHGGVRLHGIAR